MAKLPGLMHFSCVLLCYLIVYVPFASAAKLTCAPFNVTTQLTPTSIEVEHTFLYEGNADRRMLTSSITKFCAALGIGTDCTEHILGGIDCTNVTELKCEQFELITRQTPESEEVSNTLIYHGAAAEPFEASVAAFCADLALGSECIDYIQSNIKCWDADSMRQPTQVSEHYEFNMVAAVVFRNAAKYLAEWVEFHALVGVERLVMYNHGSDDEFMDVLAPYIASGLVDLRHALDVYPRQCWIGEPNDPSPVFDQFARFCQTPLLKHFYVDYFMRTKWYVMMDIDEFVFPGPAALQRYGSSITLPQLLDAHYSDFDTVSLYFSVFGLPKDGPVSPLLIESHRERGPHDDAPEFAHLAPWNAGLKQISRMSSLLNNFYSLHRRACLHCREVEVPKSSPWLRGNHYQYLSKAELEKKAFRHGNQMLLFDSARNDYLTSVSDDNGAGFWLSRLKANLQEANSCSRELPWAVFDNVATEQSWSLWRPPDQQGEKEMLNLYTFLVSHSGMGQWDEPQYVPIPSNATTAFCTEPSNRHIFRTASMVEACESIISHGVRPRGTVFGLHDAHETFFCMNEKSRTFEYLWHTDSNTMEAQFQHTDASGDIQVGDPFRILFSGVCEHDVLDVLMFAALVNDLFVRGKTQAALELMTASGLGTSMGSVSVALREIPMYVDAFDGQGQCVNIFGPI
jgi:hypothetical protein